jgi:hypothetical protein
MSNRRAKIPINKTASDKANKVVWEKYPELKNRQLTMGPEDQKYREVWMDAYVVSGGKVENIDSKSPVKALKPKCPLDKSPKIEPPKKETPVVYDIVELVEIINQDKEKWVKGAAMATGEIADSVSRNDKDGSDYKQYVNIDQDLEGTAKRHPEYGRKIVFKARIKQTSGEKKLNGIWVKFTSKKTDGPNKTNPGGTDPDVWSDSRLVGYQKEGFNNPSGYDERIATTDDKGWTAPVSFYLSAYAGDKFELSAELHPSIPGAGKKIKTSANYVVWKKFWYQLTYADGFAAKVPTNAETAYKEVFAEMIKSGEKKFVKGVLPVDLRDRTFYEEYMLKQGGGASIVATIGGNNKMEFIKKPVYDKDTPKEHPLKANLIVCNYQCDPVSPSSMGRYPLTANNQEITLSKGGVGGSIICKPALKVGDLVVFAEWSKTKIPWNKEGTISDQAIKIIAARSSTLAVNIDLTSGVTGSPPVPSVANPIWIKIKLDSAENFLGESFGKGQILCVYQPGTPAGDQGSEADYNDTVTHELGHMWKQTPRPASEPYSLKVHPLQYVGHGGSGSHCRHDPTDYEHSDTLSNDVEPETKISKKAAIARSVHEVLDTENFNKGYSVLVNGTSRIIKNIVDATHIEFTTAFTAEINEVVKQTVDWNDRNQEWPSPNKGDCVMFHSFSSRCSHKFCKTCKPYLQLQDMSSI